MACFLIVTILWIFSVCLHEFGHAIVAYHGGDTSVREKGYLTFNPLKYTHPVYSLLMPVLFMMLGGIGLPGGAVYIERDRLRSREWETAVSLAGPAMNVLWVLALCEHTARFRGNPMHPERQAQREYPEDVHGRAGERNRRLPLARSQPVPFDVNRPARQPDAAQHHEEHRHQQAVNRMGVFQRIESEIALLTNTRVAAVVGDDGVTEFVQADREDPQNRDDEKTGHGYLAVTTT